MTRLNDITGQRFGRLIALEIAQRGRRLTWRCQCDCGTKTIQKAQNLRGGQVKSCGCEQGWKHGLARSGQKHPLYSTWIGMRARCHDPKHRAYPWYGGRGIKVCDRWNDFTAFLADMGPKPPGTEIDRINNDGNYEPGNCRWATKAEQVANQRRRSR